MNQRRFILLFVMLFVRGLLEAQTLVWEENFNGASINTTTWKYEIGDGCDKGICGWGNSELEYYTDRTNNARIENGSLVIEAHRENYQGKSFTSARLKTEGLVQFKYGTVEARIKIPDLRNGLWPAFWTLGSVGGVWPAIGEIDIAELGISGALSSGVGNKRVSSATHWSQGGAHRYSTAYRDSPDDLSADYHLYKMVWTSQYIKMYLDGVEYYSFDISGGAAADLSEFHHPHYLLLNLAVGGTYTGILSEAGITAPLPGKMLVDYIKLYQNPGDELFVATNNPTPSTAAPTPTRPQSEVISLYSNAYTNVPVDTWSAVWDAADVSDIQIAGNDTKLYQNLTYAGVEFTNNVIDASAQTHLHIDVWTPNSTSFKLKLVDFGANGVYQGSPNDDSEHELTFTQGVGSWISYDIPLSDFTNLTSRSHLAQLIISGSSNSTVYIDNVYFYKFTLPTPQTAAPTPTKPQSDVISLYSNAYTNVPVDTWSAVWDAADVSDIQIAGNDTKLYQNLVYAGIEFTSNVVDASAQTHLHMDIWTPNSTSFKVKLVDFGANGVYQGSPNDDSEHELAFTPAQGSWVSYDIPLSNFTNLASRSHLAQMIISGSNSTVYVDNVYFYKDNAPTTPQTAAPTPTKPQSDVISLYSNAYTNVPVDTWSAVWDAADVSDVQIVGNDTKLYQNLVYAGIEFTSNVIDASAQTHLHMDIWTPNSTSFKVKLVDFGANGVYQGSPNDDSEHELSFTPAQGSWVSYDIPLSNFTNLASRSHLAQMIISGSNSTVYVDNVYFYKDNAPTTPQTAAPTPTKPQSEVISLYSNAYTNVPVDTWSAVWDAADVSDVQIADNDTKLYQNLVYAGIEFTSNVIDASAQTHLHMDIWTPNSTSFKVKLVDFGANGVYQGSPNDDTEHELSFTPAQGSWVSYDIPLSDFTNLTSRSHLAQMIISGSNSTVYVDNVYFYKNTVAPTAPMTAAPTPTKPQSEVISLYSNAYTNVPVDTWSAVWDAADVSDVQIESNDTKLYQNLVYAGIEFTSSVIDASAQTHLHMDIWTPNSTSFKVKLVDFGANGVYQGSPNDDTEHELSFTPAQGSWVSYDIPLSDFTNLTSRSHLAQMIISGSNSKVYVDNVYFYNNNPCQPPVITCPANQNITLGSFECSKVVTFNDPSVSSTCSTTVSRIDAFTNIQSGSSLSAGVYDLKYRVTNASNTTADCVFRITINGQSTTGRLVCVPSLTVALDNKQCATALDARQLLTDNTYYCLDAYNITIPDRTSNNITSADLGKTLSITVKDKLNSSCTSLVKVVDNQAPVLSTPQDLIITCGDISKNDRVLVNVSNPAVVNECSKVDFTYQDKVLSPSTGQTGFTVIPANFPIDKSFDYGMGSQSSKIIIRTYTATDEYNNSSTVQRVIYIKNISLSDVVCPKDMTLQCENGNYNASIAVTGTPQLSNSGRSLQDVSCAIDYFYSDETASTGQGYTIKRAWTLIKRGTQERQVCTQTITVVCSNTPLLSISGAIKKETGESISATVKLSNGVAEISQQEGSAYKFSDLAYSDLYRLRAERDNDVLNGVTTYDISRISKHILGLQPLTSPYQMIAADVNKDGSIDGADMLYIRNVLLKRISRFPNNSSWRFVPKSYKFTNVTNPFNEDFPEILSLSKLSANETQGDFVAVKVGDVNLSSQSQYHATAVRSSNIDYIEIDDVQLRQGEEQTVKVELNNKQLSSLQMSLKIDKSGADLLKVSKGDLPAFESANMELDRATSSLRSVWNNPLPEALKEENTVMYITVKAKKDMWLHDVLSIDERDMVNVSYDTEGEEKSLALRFKAVEMKNPQFELHQNRPNPFSHEGTISFVLPEGGVASLEVYDLTGRTVYAVKKAFAKGYNEVIIGANELPTAGTYFYRLQSDTYSATKKMQVSGH